MMIPIAYNAAGEPIRWLNPHLVFDLDTYQDEYAEGGTQYWLTFEPADSGQGASVSYKTKAERDRVIERFVTAPVRVFQAHSTPR